MQIFYFFPHKALPHENTCRQHVVTSPVPEGIVATDQAAYRIYAIEY